MTNITWGDPIPHDGSPECPADAREAPCMVWEGRDWLGAKGVRSGKAWVWNKVIAYRLPITAPDVTADLAAAAKAARDWFHGGN